MENDVTYRVKVSTPNCFLIFRGKKLRTPVECCGVFEKELPVLKLQMKKGGFKYEIVNESDIIEKYIKPLVLDKNDQDIKVEELYNSKDDYNSIIDQLIAEEKVIKK